MNKICLVSGLLIAISLGGGAAIPKLMVKPYKKNLFIKQGIFRGGRSTRQKLSVLDIRRTFSKKQLVERIAIDIGTEKGKAKLPHLGYFHVSIEKNPRRIVIDLEKTVKTAIDEKLISEIFKKSYFVQSAQITMDPEDY